MSGQGGENLEYLATMLHGRRCGLAEGERLASLCRLNSLGELSRSLFSSNEDCGACGLQRRLKQDLARELASFLPYLAGREAALFSCFSSWPHLENYKAIIRGLACQIDRKEISAQLLDLPGLGFWDTSLSGQAEKPEATLLQAIGAMPAFDLKAYLSQALPLRAFYLEAAIDCAHYRQLMECAARFSWDRREPVRQLLRQQADFFHLSLAMRGRLGYGLKAELLLSFHIGDSGINKAAFAAMLHCDAIRPMLNLASGHAFDQAQASLGGGEGHGWEAAAWRRFARLANDAFYRGGLAMGCVLGYAALRRVEVANLITLSEAMRAGMASDAVRQRMIASAA